MTADTTGAVLPESLDDSYLGFESQEACDGCGPGVSALWLVFTGAGPLTLCGAHYRRYRKCTEKE